jgi:hypothetical protein
VQSATCNPIYYFYQNVKHDANGKIGNASDKHYKCYHRNKHIITVMKASKSNLTGTNSLFFPLLLFLSLIPKIGLVRNLKTSSSPMYHLYNVLKERSADQPITQKEINIASAKKTMEAGTASEYMKKLEVASENILQAFEKQVVNAAVCVQLCASCIWN